MSEEDVQSQQQESMQDQQTDDGSQEQSASSSSNIFDNLPEDLRNDPSLKDIKDAESLAKSYVNAQKMIGDSIRIPSDEAGEDQWKKFYEKLEKVPNVARIDDQDQVLKKLGKPDDPDNYQIKDDLEIQDSDQLKEFKQYAHEAGLTNEQINKVLEFESKRHQNMSQEVSQKSNEFLEKLQQEWGKDFDNRIEGAKEIFAQYEKQYPEAAEQLKDPNNPASNNPIVIKALSELYRTYAENGTIKPDSGIQYGTSTQEAQNKLQDIMANPNHPYWNAMSAGHDQAVQKVRELYKQIEGVE